jgi:dihydrolipoamide dehydrogenase
MTAREYDVSVVGGGPAGYAAALRCAEHGMTTALIERADVGGTCLNVGCIPSKAIIHAADVYHSVRGADVADLGITVEEASIDLSATMRWKDAIVGRLRDGVAALLARGQVDVIRGTAEVIDAHTIRVTSGNGTHTRTTGTLTTGSLILATGSHPVELSGLPFGDGVLSSTDALALVEVPDRLVVVGAGYIGLELGTAMRKLGAEVAVIEKAPRILPLFPPALARPVARRIEQLGIAVHVDAVAVERGRGSIVIQRGDGGRRELAADAILVTVGRRPTVEGFGLERLQLKLEGGAIAIDDQCRTSAPGVYAVGDATGEPMLAHRGIAQGQLAADVIAGKDRAWDHRAMPAVCFTDPEVFSVGTEPGADGAASGVVEGIAPFRANGRALTLGEGSGFIRVVAERGSGAVRCVQGVGPGVCELAAPASYAIEFGATLDDLQASIVPHPALGEALTDAVVNAIRRAGERAEIAPASRGDHR